MCDVKTEKEMKKKVDNRPRRKQVYKKMRRKEENILR